MRLGCHQPPEALLGYIYAVLYVAAYCTACATVFAWFSAFFLNALVSRASVAVSRRVTMAMIRPPSHAMRGSAALRKANTS